MIKEKYTYKLQASVKNNQIELKWKFIDYLCEKKDIK